MFYYVLCEIFVSVKFELRDICLCDFCLREILRVILACLIFIGVIFTCVIFVHATIFRHAQRMHISYFQGMVYLSRLPHYAVNMNLRLFPLIHRGNGFDFRCSLCLRMLQEQWFGHSRESRSFPSMAYFLCQRCGCWNGEEYHLEDGYSANAEEKPKGTANVTQDSWKLPISTQHQDYKKMKLQNLEYTHGNLSARRC